MRFPYDPTEPAYRDEADARGEFTRTGGVCVSCRRCVERCDVFPRLFELVERFDDLDPGRLTPEEQDGLVAACFQCGGCAHGCPYGMTSTDGDLVEFPVDVPHLMVRMAAMRRAQGHVGWGEELTSRVLAASSLRRGPLARAVGIAQVRSTDRTGMATSGTTVAEGDRVAPPATARALLLAGACPGAHDERTALDIARVVEALGIATSPAGVRDCGVSVWESGDVDRFARRGRSVVRSLAAALRSDADLDLVVVDPACLHRARRRAADADRSRRRSRRP